MMRFFANLLPTLIISNETIVTVLGHAGLTAVTDTPGEYVQHLYEQLRNEDPPSEEDPAVIGDASTRQSICEDIFGSGVFLGPAVKLEQIYEELDEQSNSSDSTQRETNLHVVDSLRPFDPTNQCIPRKLEVPTTVDRLPHFHEVREHVFVCLAKKESSSNDIVLYYVSKEYNLLETEPVTVGRFVFGDRTSSPRELIKLAEEPATVGGESLENIELQYLRIRGQRQPETSDPLADPVCRLITTDPKTNHYHRLCVKVLTSSYFRRVVRNVIRVRSSRCFEKLVSFRVNRVKKRFNERMISCYATSHAGELREFYISRAYKSHEVEMMRKSFKKCSMTNALHGMEDDLSWDNSDKSESHEDLEFPSSADKDDHDE